MEKLQVSRAVIVEGKYDQIKLSSLIDGLIIRTDGFRIYKDKQKMAFIRTVARKKGLVVVTDSDRAGFQLRGFLRSIVGDADIVHVYIPQISGKEKRKAVPGAERLLGVEGIDADTLRELFQRSGALASSDGGQALGGADEVELPSNDNVQTRRIERMDFFTDGLIGGSDASAKRQKLLGFLKLPTYLTANGLLGVINTLMTYEEYRAYLDGE